MNRPTRAFTLIELLVVVAIITALIGILLPSLSHARDKARMVVELAASRQLSLAYTSYALESRGQLLPGYTDKQPGTDGDGNTLTGEPVKRYPWRLVGYINHGINGSILVNEQAKALARQPNDMTVAEWQYAVSLFPSFGMNFYYVGGDDKNWPNSKRPIRRLEESVQPARLIVFASAHGLDQQGYFKLLAPKDPSGYSATGWSETYDETNIADAWGFVHPRWDNQAVFALVDGHCETLGLDAMRDMTRWSNQAARAGDRDWTPTAP